MADIIQALSTIDVSSWITAISTLILALLTTVNILLTKKIFDSRLEPYVIVTVVHDELRPTIFQLHIKNIGTGLAQNIHFETSRPMPARAWGLDFESAKSPSQMIDGPFITGIANLGPGEVRKIDWGQYGGIKKYLGESTIEVKCIFSNNRRQLHEVVCTLEVASFEGNCAATCGLAAIGKELIKLVHAVERLSDDR